ncbi:malto-oligosyltrehalose synthase [Olivibacter sitiensis]|uniref:malto-oligosyltrehalose synthase n=1 Tax=Olivibacter sitiensis TaxID=376470 RepID=UPI0003F5833E|nr:malto-oligosyltrehalose synthase [Olivibacter sitiensis]
MKTINPIATYRLQFHSRFTFKDASRLVPYLSQSGIGSVYASPVFEAVAGSNHGYDVVNPLRINPEIGTLAELRNLIAKLQKHAIAWVQDIVPNHMAFHPSNTWLMDVLERGKTSTYAHLFDTSYASDFFHGPIMVPFLGSPLQEVIDKGELKLEWNGKKLQLRYFDQAYPVNAEGHDFVRNLNADKGKKGIAISPDTLEQVNTNTENLLHLCQIQHYRLCHWLETDEKINYRRFFTVNGLICIRVEDDDVFSLTHGLIKDLVDEGLFRGLRIDHIDGLFDPKKYLDDLRNLVGPEVYIVAEKILETDECLPLDWPLQGTSGYDFLALSNRLFTMGSSESQFDRLYQDLVGDRTSVAQQILDKKELIWRSNMQGEVGNLLHMFKQLRLISLNTIRQIGEQALRETIAYTLVYCPVYRYYGNRLPLLPRERKAWRSLFERMKEQQPHLLEAIHCLEGLFLDKSVPRTTKFRQKWLYFYQRLMQFSGPLMAKGVEDTLMYTYNRFVVHNEVGDAPDAFGISKSNFHKAMQYRQQYWPLAMSATATHDTKRGEDTRARLHALSCLPQRWQQVVADLEHAIKHLNTATLPDANDRYLIYQTLVATYPFDSDKDDYEQRLTAYWQKALREAKRHSNWTRPNEPYEKKCIHFAHVLLDDDQPYKAVWLPLQEEVACQGMLSSLGQTLLKITAPGVPDIYQGTEGWDLSLVDPDNRRPVDYPFREERLRSFQKEQPHLLALWQAGPRAMPKLWLMDSLLHYRRSHADLFAQGEYIPLRVRGRYRKQVLAFARQYKNRWSITIMGIHVAALSQEQNCPPEDINWKNTHVEWPTHWPAGGKEIIQGVSFQAENDRLMLAALWKCSLPLALLNVEKKERKRAAGILMAISSLPSAFGIGDIGPEAKAFVRQLAIAGQGYWQLLPLNPAGDKEHYSPYSAFSAFAGNPLFISPELLAIDGLLSAQELKAHTLPNDGVVDYPQSERAKQALLHLAFNRFCDNRSSAAYADFLRFMDTEKEWLEDFALYLAIKKSQRGKAWYLWPQALRMRQKNALATAGKRYAQYMLEVKWQQFQFMRQWQQLRAYSHGLDVRLFGDLPIYVNYDSVDVWANRQLFQLDKNGQIEAVAGVPPDYFNAEGQLWGMPVFNWQAHKKENYRWWIARLKKNLQLFDVLRLDHFRAFHDYWQVSATESTAINGDWKAGPGVNFFQTVKDTLGDLPFVAEDLGDINEGVYALRDKFHMPGMQVLQFAFGEDLPDSLHAPHQYCQNSVVYTGTHDNNTTVGWYRKELDKTSMRRLQQYIGHKVTETTVAKDMIRLAYASVAHLAIIPIQDILSLDERARMNTPATVGINWGWRLKSSQLKQQHLDWLRGLIALYGR